MRSNYKEKGKYNSNSSWTSLFWSILCIVCFLCGYYYRGGQSDNDGTLESKLDVHSFATTSSIEATHDSNDIITATSFRKVDASNNGAITSSISDVTTSLRAQTSPSSSSSASYHDLSPSLLRDYSTLMPSYENILRSCLGDHCFNTRPENSLRDRVGVLGPPGTGASIITELLNLLRMKEHPKVKSVEIIHSSNVPPYGYGKNHGWNRMIRLSRKLIPHAYSLLRTSEGHTELEGKHIDSDLFQKQVAQIVRWQCRLSHVAGVL